MEEELCGEFLQGWNASRQNSMFLGMSLSDDDSFARSSPVMTSRFDTKCGESGGRCCKEHSLGVLIPVVLPCCARLMRRDVMSIESHATATEGMTIASLLVFCRVSLRVVEELLFSHTSVPHIPHTSACLSHHPPNYLQDQTPAFGID